MENLTHVTSKDYIPCQKGFNGLYEQESLSMLFQSLEKVNCKYDVRECTLIGDYYCDGAADTKCYPSNRKREN